MRIRLWWVGLILLCWGCSASKSAKVQELNQELKAEMKGAYQEIRDDYLHSTVGTREQLEKAKMVAYEFVSNSEFKDQYAVTNPVVDGEEGMPEMVKYYFIQFASAIPSLSDECFLVVVSAGSLKIVYSDVYTKPLGDSFYRYKDVLNAIQ